MRLDATVCYTVGEPGSGKTYRRCAVFLGDEFLPNTDGHVYTNYPIKIDAMASYVAAKGKYTEQQIKDRIHIIDDRTLKLWMRGESGPWEYFADIDTDGCVIAIDEIHNYCSKYMKKNIKQLWEEWLGEVRHMGAQIEVITQDPGKCDALIERHAGVRRWLQKDEHRADPFLKIPMKAWYEMIAKFFTGKYKPWNWEIEQNRLLGRWRTRRTNRYHLEPKYFELYDSYAAPQKGGGTAGSSEEYQYQRRSHVGMLWWFFRQSPFRIMLTVLGMACFMIAITGNGDIFIKGLLAYMKNFQPKSMRQQQDKHKQSQTRLVRDDGQPVVIDQQSADQQTIELQAKLHELNEQLEQAQQINEELTDELQRNCAVVLMTKDSATFQDGVTVHVGDRIKYGHYAGAMVDEIDYKQRVVVLDTGDILRMGGGMFEPQKGESDRPGNGHLPRDLRTSKSHQQASRTR